MTRPRQGEERTPTRERNRSHRPPSKNCEKRSRSEKIWRTGLPSKARQAKWNYGYGSP